MKKRERDTVRLAGESLPLPTSSANAALVLVSVFAYAFRHALTAIAHYCDDGTQRGARVAIILREIVAHTNVVKPNPWTKAVDTAIEAANDRISREGL